MLATRAFVERHLRRRLSGVENIRLLGGHDVVGLLAEGRRCVGVRVLSHRRSAAAGAVRADLVVDAMVPRSQLTHWLANEWATVVAIEQPGDLRHYEWQVLRLPLPAGAKTLTRGPAEPPYEWMIMGVERGCHVVAVSRPSDGLPPMTGERTFAIARHLEPDLAVVVRSGSPVGPPYGFVAPWFVRRRFDLATEVPSGIVAVGASVLQPDSLSGADLALALQQVNSMATIENLHPVAAPASPVGDADNATGCRSSSERAQRHRQPSSGPGRIRGSPDCPD